MGLLGRGLGAPSTSVVHCVLVAVRVASLC